MSDRLWILLVSIAPLVLCAVVPLSLAWARRHHLRAKQAIAEGADLKRRLADLQKAEIVGGMIAGLVHDLNNVSMAVMGNLDLVLIQGGLNGTTLERVTTARAAADKGNEVMRPVLQFSQGDRGVQETDVGEILAEAEVLLRLMMPRAIKLKVLLPRTDVILRVNKVQLFQVVLNLVVNARDAIAPEGGCIMVTLDDAGDTVLIQVSDNGCGIPKDVLGRIFDWQFTTKAAGHGTGLGLGIVQEIVREMDGSIAVDSTVGSGTTFTVTIPRH